MKHTGGLELCVGGEVAAKLIIASSKRLFADAKLDTTDGCRFDFDDGWLHLRASNTEPVMRAIAEAKDRNSAGRYINTVLDIRKQMGS